MTVPPVTGAIPENLADLVGNTPMVRLTRLAPDCDAELLGKLEAYNPAGSVKDRIGVSMIDVAEAEGRIEPGRNTIVESTSGNTGIALAFVCAAKGYDLILTMPQGMSRERENLLRLYGAEVVLVESMGGMDEAVAGGAPHLPRARRLLGAEPVLQPRQPGDPPAHDRRGDLARHRRSGRRAGGAASARAARSPAAASGSRSATPTCAWWPSSRRPRRCCPADSPGPHKIQGIGAGFVPEVFNRDVVDEILPVDDEDAIETARRSAAREGVLAGISGGAALYAAIEVGSRPEMSGKRIVAIVPDSGERYVSTPFFAP